MMRITFDQAAAWANASPWKVDGGQTITKVTIDSRDVCPQSLFVALPGQRTHGNRFVTDVWKKGAVALVDSNFADRGGPLLVADDPLAALGRMMRRAIDAHGVSVVGITGSVGKTSAKELCSAVLSTRFVTAHSLGNYNTAIGLPLSYFSAPPGISHFVAEMGMSAAGEILQMTAIAPPEIAVITMIGPSHLEKLGSMEAIQAAKGEILQGLLPSGTAVLNYDDLRVRALGEGLQGHDVRWFGRTPGLDAVIQDAVLENGITKMSITVYGERVVVRLPWQGTHHAYNVAAALLTGHYYGIDANLMCQGLEAISPSRSRIQVHKLGSVTLLEDAYNSSPLSAKAAIDVLSSYPGRRVAVLGDMLELGAAEEEAHREVGRYAAERAHWVIGVGKRAQWIVEQARQAGTPTQWMADREQALQWLEQWLVPGDTLLLKASRAMQLDQLSESLRRWGGPR